MNYHIMIDDKFIDPFIDDAEKAAPNTNLYFVRGTKSNAVYVKSDTVTWIEDIWSTDFKNKMASLEVTDKVFFHWYDMDAGRLALSLNPDIKIYIPLWGGDFYEEPFLHNKNWIHDPITLKYVNSHYVYPQRWAKRPNVLLKQLVSLFNKYHQSRKHYLLKQKAVKRVNYILLNEMNTGETALIRKLYNAHQFQPLPFSYNQNFDQAQNLPAVSTATKSITTIQIGNSAAESNNHLDILDVLKKFAANNIAVTAPLSYGTKNYAADVKKMANTILGNKFKALENFMGREEYVNYLNTVDIAIMYHNRSQALGNCVGLLSLGKKLYLKKNNPLWQLFVNGGVLVFDASKISQTTYADFCKPLTAEEIATNKTNLRKLFSEETRVRWLRDILE